MIPRGLLLRKIEHSVARESGFECYGLVATVDSDHFREAEYWPASESSLVTCLKRAHATPAFGANRKLSLLLGGRQ